MASSLSYERSSTVELTGNADKAATSKSNSTNDINDSLFHYRQDFATTAGIRNLGPAHHDNGAKAIPGVGADHSGTVDRFFSSIRVPASFLASTSFSQIFGIAINGDDTPVQRQLQILCLLCQGLAFILSMNVVFLSSSALVRSLSNNYDPYAESGYDFLFREFHFEFVCVQWSFQVSLFGFLLAVTAKILYAFELFDFQGENYDRNRLELGIGVCLCMGSLMIHLFSYVNSTLVGWNNLFDMTRDLMNILVKRGADGDKRLEPLSLVVALVGLVFVTLALIPGEQI
eukprot:CAMPEP_0178740502 /NCGR_PEP_ID=MMETSP0744-20121128/4626_1 /TAXON_ID=913974 /ORGANISM="Nitzschia punctata, Strain CCMP561" /LENGTH=286 /DNA_ID=CAMNT_0020393283 /DNA_START=4 /DNA_END=864 /DNA_ORIENTATION=-